MRVNHRDYKMMLIKKLTDVEKKAEARGSLYKILDDVLPEVRDYTHPERTEIREQFI